MIWLSLALASDVGVAVGGAGVRSSAGHHPVEPAVAAWYRRSVGEHGLFELEGWAATVAEPLVTVGTVRTNFLRPSLLVGWQGGTRATTVGLSCGPGLTLLQGGVRGDQLMVAAGLRAKLDMRIPLGESWLLVGHAGLGTRGFSGDVDLMVGLGRRL